MSRAEFLQFAGAKFAAAREVFLPQDALDPDVDRESAQSFIGEKHHAIGHLGADPRQLAKSRPQLVVRQGAPRFEICFPAGHSFCRREESLRPITQPTIAQLSLCRAGQSFRGRESIYVSPVYRGTDAKTLAQLS
jgi:hypothetical protein